MSRRRPVWAMSGVAWAVVAVFGAVDGKPVTVVVAGAIAALNVWLFATERASSGEGGALTSPVDLEGETGRGAAGAARATSLRPSKPLRPSRSS